METTEEARAVDEVIDRLSDRFPDVSREHITTVVREAHLELDGKPVRDFVPVLVEHDARDRLRAEGANPIPISEADAPSTDAVRRDREPGEPGEPPAGELGPQNGDLGGRAV